MDGSDGEPDYRFHITHPERYGNFHVVPLPDFRTSGTRMVPTSHVLFLSLRKMRSCTWCWGPSSNLERGASRTTVTTHRAQAQSTSPSGPLYRMSRIEASLSSSSTICQSRKLYRARAMLSEAVLCLCGELCVHCTRRACRSAVVDFIWELSSQCVTAGFRDNFQFWKAKNHSQDRPWEEWQMHGNCNCIVAPCSIRKVANFSFSMPHGVHGAMRCFSMITCISTT